LFFVETAKAQERNDAPGPLNFRGCDLTAEWRRAMAHVRAQLPAAAPNFISGRAPVCATESPKLSLLGAAPRRPAKSKFEIRKSKLPFGAVAEK